MAEITAIASAKLARLRPDFLKLSPEEQLAFVTALRARRSSPKTMKSVNSRRTANVEGKKIKSKGEKGQGPVEDQAQTPPEAS